MSQMIAITMYFSYTIRMVDDIEWQNTKTKIAAENIQSKFNA